MLLMSAGHLLSAIVGKKALSPGSVLLGAFRKVGPKFFRLSSGLNRLFDNVHVEFFSITTHFKYIYKYYLADIIILLDVFTIHKSIIDF